MLASKAERLELQLRNMVASGLSIAVVIPCYNVQEHIETVVRHLPDYVSLVVPVNDASGDRTAVCLDELAAADSRVRPVLLSRNQGVGGATLAGLQAAFAAGAHVAVKMDGDNQMDPAYLPALVMPLVMGRADYAKGNRFRDAVSLAQMPVPRRMGNAVLSFLTKLASGYWSIFDPTNGYVAICREVFELLPLTWIHPRFFFESSMLLALNLVGAVVVDIPMVARYGVEKSNLRIRQTIVEFPVLLARGFLRRLWFRKVLYSLTMEAILGGFGLVFTLAGLIFGLIEFYHYAIVENLPAPAGTVMTAALPFFIGFQMLITASLLDIQSEPSSPLGEQFVFDQTQ